MATSYEKLYENLLPKFRSYEIPLMSTEEVKDYLHDFLIPAISRFHVCRKNLNDRDDIVQRFNIELSDVEKRRRATLCPQTGQSRGVEKPSSFVFTLFIVILVLAILL